MNDPKNIARLEALLFIHGEPLPKKKIASVLEISAEEADQLLAELGEILKDDSRGLWLVGEGEKVQLTTKPELIEILKNFIKEQLTEDLSPASVETLALITYLGPISRNQLEYHRG